MYGTRHFTRRRAARPCASSSTLCRRAAPGSPTTQERLGQGRDNVKNLFATNKELADEIEQQVRANVGKLYAKSAVPMPNASPAKPLEIPAPAAEEAKPASRAAAAKIDIEADDVE